MSIKKIIVVALLMFNTSALSEKVNVIKHSRPGGLIDRMNEIIAQSLGDKFGEFIKVENCVKATKVIEKSKDKVLTAWPTERESHGNPCNLDNRYLLSTFSNSPYHITYFRGNSEASDLNFLLTGKEVVIGVWDSDFWAPPQTAFLQSLNPNVKVVRYKSKPFRTALASGEIDYKVVSFPGQDPVLAIMDGETLNPTHQFSDMGYSMMFVGNFEYNIVDVYNSKAWKDRKDKTHRPWMSTLPRQKQIDAVEVMLSAITHIHE